MEYTQRINALSSLVNVTATMTLDATYANVEGVKNGRGSS